MFTSCPNRASKSCIQPPVARRVVSCLSLGAVFLLAGCDTAAPRLDSAPIGAEAPAPFGAPGVATDGATVEVAREIEEADVVKVVGDKLYVLNRYRGLIIIDVGNPDAPAIVGALSLTGRGVEMYVVGGQVFALLSADVFLPYFEDSPVVDRAAPTSFAPVPDYDGSRLAIIDVSDPTSPTLEGKIDLAGYANDSRRVGNVIYVIGGNVFPYYLREGGEQVDEGFVASILVADPGHITPVDRVTFTRQGLEMHVADNVLFVAGSEYDSDAAQSLTIVQAVDISDPDGAIVTKDEMQVTGVIRNHFFMSAFDGVFRIATESSGFGFQTVRVLTFDLSDLDDIVALGETEVIQNESLEAVRFDGNKGYLVTFLRVDPLFVVDLSDPTMPTVSGAVEVPGFSTYLEPRGDRLIAMGIDDTDGFRPALAYYDVSNPAAPTQLSRIVLGPPGSFTESEAVYDEKAFRIIDAMGLIAVPFQHTNYSDVPAEPPGPGVAVEPAGAPVVADFQCVSAVQLVDFDDTQMTQRGWFAHDGRVLRVGELSGRVYSLSDAAFQTVDVTDRDKPTKLASAELLEAEDMARVIYDCNGGIPIDPGFLNPPPFGGNPIEILLTVVCGNLGPLPLAGLLAMFIHRTRQTHRRRC